MFLTIPKLLLMFLIRGHEGVNYETIHITPVKH